MKKVLYILLLIAEAVIAVPMTISAGVTFNWLISGAAVAISVALLVWLVFRLKKTDDAKRRRKIKTGIALALLIPSMPIVIYVAAVIIALVASM